MFELRPNPSANDDVETSMSLQTCFRKNCYVYRKSWWAGVAKSLIANRYGLGRSRIESRCGRDFPNMSRPTPGVYTFTCAVGTGSLFLG